jgi:hypothetical protein
MASIAHQASTAIHRSELELPFITGPDGTAMQLLQVDLSVGVWVVRSRYRPGTTLQTHKHTDLRRQPESRRRGPGRIRRRRGRRVELLPPHLRHSARDA